MLWWDSLSQLTLYSVIEGNFCAKYKKRVRCYHLFSSKQTKTLQALVLKITLANNLTSSATSFIFLRPKLWWFLCEVGKLVRIVCPFCTKTKSVQLQKSLLLKQDCVNRLNFLKFPVHIPWTRAMTYFKRHFFFHSCDCVCVVIINNLTKRRKFWYLCNGKNQLCMPFTPPFHLCLLHVCEMILSIIYLYTYSGFNRNWLALLPPDNFTNSV